MPVREAIRRLEAEGWVVHHRHQGAQVAPVNGDAWIDAMTMLAVLEGYATALSAPHSDAAGLRALREINDDMDAAIGRLDLEAVSDANRRFHTGIYERCPNGHLQEKLATTQERLDTLRATIFTVVPSRGNVSRAEHERLLTLVERGCDPLEIELAAREHKLHTVAAYRERLTERKPS
jgi:DNA-binding GntR family transcriptional regulator